MSREFKINEMIEEIIAREWEIYEKVNFSDNQHKIWKNWEQEKQTIIVKYAKKICSENEDFRKVCEELAQMAFPCRNFLKG